MKKVFVCLFTLLFCLSCLFAEPIISDYKNSEFSDDSEPMWIEQLFKKNNTKYIYKKYNNDIKKTDKIFYGTAIESDKNTAELYSKNEVKLQVISAVKKELNISDDNLIIDINKFVYVDSFWCQLEDSDTNEITYQYYSLYKISDDSWQNILSSLKNKD